MDGTEKIRVLHQKKPCSDSKTVKEVVGDSVGEPGKDVEFGVMIMGYTASNLPSGATTGDAAIADKGAKAVEVADKAHGKRAREVLEGEVFWDDLKSFVMQRVGDEQDVGEVLDRFRAGWTKR